MGKAGVLYHRHEALDKLAQGNGLMSVLIPRTLHVLMFMAQRITYAKGKSDAVAKVDGTYKPDKKQRAQKNAAARGTSREGSSSCLGLHLIRGFYCPVAMS